MSKLSKFLKNELSSNAAEQAKGGVFCEIYVGRTGNMHNAMLLMEKVDGVMVENENQNFV